MATTAILSALAEEQHGLLALLQDARMVKRAGRSFWLGNLHGQAVVLGLSRVGKVAAATTATSVIEAFAVQRMLFTGVAGGIGDGIHVGDAVVATHFVQHDLDASPLFPRFEVPLYHQSQFACDGPLTGLLVDACCATLDSVSQHESTEAPATRARVHRGLIASGDQFICTAPAAAALTAALRGACMDALAVEMEGAAVAQVCHDYGVPFAAVRSISDRADEQATRDFQYFVAHVASHYAVGIVDRFVRTLPAT